LGGARKLPTDGKENSYGGKKNLDEYHYQDGKKGTQYRKKSTRWDTERGGNVKTMQANQPVKSERIRRSYRRELDEKRKVDLGV